MNRRDFLKNTLLAAAAAPLSQAAGRQIPIGLNSYCLRAMKWNDIQLLDYAAGLKLDALFLQDSLDPEAMEPNHWPKVKEHAKNLGLHIETGTGAVLPKTPADFDASVRNLRQAIIRASALGSPIVRCLAASDREHLPPGSAEQHIETMIKLLRAVRTPAMDAGVKIAIENHKDFQAWETRTFIEGAGKEFVGSYLDTGNPVFVLENPMTTLEVLGPYAVTVHLRDSVIYEHPRGVAVQWVPLGEGVVDFRRFLARMREVCPPTYVYIKPITGRPPQVLPYLEADFWKLYPKAKAADLAQFLALAKSGHPYENHMVIEDLPGRPAPAPFVAAIQYQQRDHMERSIDYAKKTLDLGAKWLTN
jgi:sugar phosphate isomerase/epimerase